jgi:hypothetical protein
MRKKLVLGAVATVLTVGAVPLVQAEPIAVVEPRTIVFNGEGNNLDIYDVTDLDDVRERELVPAANRGGLDMNAQICFKEIDGVTYFINGEDTAQGGAGDPGWGWFELTGDTFDTLGVMQLGKLVPEYVPNEVSGEENYGCGFLSNGNLVTSEVGDQYPGLPNTGELILWFHDGEGGFTQGFGHDENGIPHGAVPSCHLDTGVATSGGILIREENGEEVIYLASNRPGNDGNTGGIFRYSNIPTTLEDCASATVTKELAIPAAPYTGITPSALAEAPNGNLYMSSVFDGVISEWTLVDTPLGSQWVHARNLIGPPAGTPVAQFGDSFGSFVPPLDTELTNGTPFGIGVGPDGTVYYADIGIALAAPMPAAGDVYAIAFDDAGNPLPPQKLNTTGQEFPDGIGVVQLDLITNACCGWELG